MTLLKTACPLLPSQGAVGLQDAGADLPGVTKTGTAGDREGARAGCLSCQAGIPPVPEQSPVALAHSGAWQGAALSGYGDSVPSVGCPWAPSHRRSWHPWSCMLGTESVPGRAVGVPVLCLPQDAERSEAGRGSSCQLAEADAFHL